VSECADSAGGFGWQAVMVKLVFQGDRGEPTGKLDRNPTNEAKIVKIFNPIP
jgi:hypothetical protein